MPAKNKTLGKRVPAAVREHNKALMLQALYPSKTLSRAAFAKLSGLTRATVSDIASELIEEGLVAEVGYDESNGPGKRGLLLHLVPSGRNIIALDLSTPYLFRGAVMELDGRVITRDALSYSEKGERNLTYVVELCRRLLDSLKAPLLGIGIACPGIITRDGKVSRSENLGWSGVDLKGQLCQSLGLPVSVDNDANDAVAAEYQFGHGSADMLLVQLNQGLGAGMLIGGETNGWAHSIGELGHIVIDKDGPACSWCGKRGCLDTFINVPTLLSDIAAEPQRRIEILERAGTMLGKALSMPVGMLGFSRVVIMGDPYIVNQVFIDSVQQELNSAIAADFREPVLVMRSVIEEDLPLLGACLSVIRDRLHFVPEVEAVDDED